MVAVALPTRSSMAPSRARLKNCWSIQSNIHASEATMKTNQWSRLNDLYQAWAGAAAVDIGDRSYGGKHARAERRKRLGKKND
jgi:hypothetical protein